MDEESDDKFVGQLKELLISGRKIEAIKVYRETMGTDLKESKEAIEKLQALIPADQLPKPKGCGSAVILVLLIFGLFAILIA